MSASSHLSNSVYNCAVYASTIEMARQAMHAQFSLAAGQFLNRQNRGVRNRLMKNVDRIARRNQSTVQNCDGLIKTDSSIGC